MSSITSSLRFPNQLNSDLKKIYTNIIPFQHLKFINSYFETNQYHGSCIRPSDVKCLLSFLLRNKEKYIRACGYVNFNGRFQTNEVKEEMDIINSKENPDLKFSVCENYFGFKGSATLVENSTKIIKFGLNCFLGARNLKEINLSGKNVIILNSTSFMKPYLINFPFLNSHFISNASNVNIVYALK